MKLIAQFLCVMCMLIGVDSHDQILGRRKVKLRVGDVVLEIQGGFRPVSGCRKLMISKWAGAQREENHMNTERIEGKWNDIKGQAKAKWAKFTDDDLLLIDGKRDQFIGKLQEHYGLAKEKAESEMNDWLKSFKKA